MRRCQRTEDLWTAYACRAAPAGQKAPHSCWQRVASMRQREWPGKEPKVLAVEVRDERFYRAVVVDMAVMRDVRRRISRMRLSQSEDTASTSWFAREGEIVVGGSLPPVAPALPEGGSRVDVCRRRLR